VSLLYLLDANVLSEPARPRPNQRVLEELVAHRGEIATAAPVWHELLHGVQRMPPSVRRDEIARYLEQVVKRSVPILPYDESAAAWHAAERARLVALGRTPPFADGQIAAIAHTQGLTLVTANQADFVSFRGLPLADWRA